MRQLYSVSFDMLHLNFVISIVVQSYEQLGNQRKKKTIWKTITKKYL